MALIRTKTRVRQAYVTDSDGGFSKGMRYTDSFLKSGLVRALMNYRVMDGGSYITPRKGISEKALKTRTYGLESEITQAKYAAPHVGFYGVYENADGEDTHGFIVVSFGVPSAAEYAYYNTEPGADYYKQTIGGGVGYIVLTDADGVQHLVNVNGFAPEVRCYYYKLQPKPVFGVHDSTLYFHNRGVLSYLVIKWNNIQGSFMATIEPVVGKEVTLSESTSIGFNMLDDDPFTFTNIANTLDTLSVQGVLPYDVNDATKIRLSANTGESIKFINYYKYYAGREYRFKWEIAEYGSTTYKTLIEYSALTTVQDGEEVAIVVLPEFNKFTLRCTMAPVKTTADRPVGFTTKGSYATLEKLIAAYPTGIEGDAYVVDTTEIYVWDVFEGKWRNDTVDEVLSKVGIYPAYTLDLPDIKELTMGERFDMNTATGMFTHAGMLGVWGVERAKNTVFLTDGYDATYFPFPHNTFTVTEEILHVVSFYGSILIFTHRSLYYVEGTQISEMWGPYKLLDNVDFSADDMHTIVAVKTGLFMRMNGMFYMLVPNSYTGKVGDMKLVNVSSPIADILFDFRGYIRNLSNRLYKFNVSWEISTVVEEYDFLAYVDNGKVRNIFRFNITETREGKYYRYQMDLILIYDTDYGVWYTEVASFPYTGLMASGAQLYSAYAKKGANYVDLYLQELNYNRSDCTDTYNTMFYGVAENDKATGTREDELNALPSTGTATVMYTVDGDTLVTDVLGTVRLLYINTPESFGTPEPYGVEAKHYLKELLPEGTVVYFEFDPYGDRVDAYDRALVWLRIGSASGTLVQVLVAQQGYVKSYYDFGATLHVTAVETAVAQALAARVGLYFLQQKEGPFYVRTAQSTNLLANYQLMDTGNRDQSPYLEKKYRELQVLISNDSPRVLEFFAEYYADDVCLNNGKRYEIEQITNPEDPAYGTIFMTEVEEPNLVLGNRTELGSWQLDLSIFPDVEVVKLILRVHGRGHYPRMIWISRNDAPYKVLGFAWTYRSMNAR